MRVTVYNKQQYAVGRGGYVFPPREATELDVQSDKKLAEIRACVYLKVTPVIAEPAKGSEVELTLEQALDLKTKAELIAEFPGLELTMRQGKPEMIATIVAALNEANEGEIIGLTDDLPPFSEWDDEGLKQLAEEWELEIPEDADHEALVAIVQAEDERRQQIAPESVENEGDTPAGDETAA